MTNLGFKFYTIQLRIKHLNTSPSPSNFTLSVILINSKICNNLFSVRSEILKHYAVCIRTLSLALSSWLQEGDSLSFFILRPVLSPFFPLLFGRYFQLLIANTMSNMPIFFTAKKMISFCTINSSHIYLSKKVFSHTAHKQFNTKLILSNKRGLNLSHK